MPKKCNDKGDSSSGEQGEQRDNETTRQRDNETTRQRDNETTGQRDNETTKQRDNETTRQRDNETTKQRNNETTRHRGEISTGNGARDLYGRCVVLTETTQALDRGGDGNVATFREGFQQLTRFRLQHALPGVDHGALGVVDHVHNAVQLCGVHAHRAPFLDVLLHAGGDARF